MPNFIIRLERVVEESWAVEADTLDHAIDLAHDRAGIKYDEAGYVTPLVLEAFEVEND